MDMRVPAAPAPPTMLSRLSAPLNALLATGVARRAEDGAIELFLDAEETAQGGMVTIAMRVPVRCPCCVADATATCASCGTERALFSAWLAVRPGIEDGTLLSPSAQLPGVIRPVVFRARHRVDESS